MPMRIGLLAYPAFILVLKFGKPSAVGVFEKAGAFTPESARKPETLEIRRKTVHKAIEKGLLIPTGDGRYYVNREAVRRADRRAMLIMALLLLATVPIVWLLW